MTLTARQLYFEAVKVGDELPPLVKPPVDRLQIARYVGAAGDWNPLYIDEPHAKAAGFPSAFAPGMIALGFLGLQPWWAKILALVGMVLVISGPAVLLAWLKLCTTGEDEVSLSRVVNVPPRGIGDTSMERLHEWAVANRLGPMIARGLG